MNQEMIDECMEKWAADIPVLLAGKDALPEFTGERGYDSFPRNNPTKAVQVYLDDFHAGWLRREALKNGTSFSAVVRQCIDKCRRADEG